MGIPQQIAGETYPGQPTEMTGTVSVADDGCVYLRTDGPHLVIWPAGTQLSQPVRLPDGTELTDGEGVTVEGRLVAVADLPGDADGYWEHVTGFCNAGGDQVVVADLVRPGR